MAHRDDIQSQLGTKAKDAGVQMNAQYQVLLPVNTRYDRERDRARARARSRAQNAISLAISFVVCFTAAGIGALASANAPAFYAQLSLPGWAPPASVFGPVWTVLYSLMAVSAWMVWRQRDEQPAAVSRALRLFGAQLAVNALWSWTFFGWHQGALAFFTILVLIALVVMTVREFRRIHSVATLLLVPYLAWITFAAALALSAWRRNPGLL